MIAVVSNPQARTYFLREGRPLYDGSVEKISMDGVSFHEEGKMPSGNPSNTRLIKRIYSVQENSNEDELAGPTAWLT